MESLKTLETMNGAGTVDPSVFLGTWTSTNRDTQGISGLVIRHADGRAFVRGFGSCAPSACDWGEVAIAVFADDPHSTQAYGFTALFDLGFKDILLQAKVEKGVLVVASFNRYKDGSGRANFFAREFFFRRSGEEHA